VGAEGLGLGGKLSFAAVARRGLIYILRVGTGRGAKRAWDGCNGPQHRSFSRLIYDPESGRSVSRVRVLARTGGTTTVGWFI